MATRAAELVAGIIDGIEGRPYRTGRPPLPTIRVVETLRFFVRKSVQWRELRAPPGAPAAPPCAVIGKVYADAAYDSAGNRGRACGTALSPASARSARRTAPGSERSAAWSSTIARGCWPASGWIGARTGSAG